MADGEIYKEILNEILGMGIKKEYIFNYRVLKLPMFDIDRYISLKRNPPSIFSINCWGGLTYHSLDLEFYSPLINMFEDYEDYFKLLKNPQYYMNEEIEFVRTMYDENVGIHYPIASCGDIILHFNHYTSFEKAKLCWDKRKKRINWDNIFVMMYTEDREIANKFLELSYEKKVCFVPFESKEKSLIYVGFRNEGNMLKVPFYDIVNGMASGKYPYYDVFDLLERAEASKIPNVRLKK